MIDIDEILGEIETDISTEKCFISVYTCERCYGGPEEGGWWYDWYNFEGAKEFSTKESAEKARRKLQDWIHNRNKEGEQQRWKNTANMPEGNSPYLDTEGYIPKGWSDGGEYTVIIEDVAGKQADNQEVPHYC